jgi:hypothetical protein
MSETMNCTSTTEALNRLVAILNRSLPMYLSDARPWMGERDEAAQKRLAQIVTDQKALVDRLARMILDLGDAVDRGEYPMEFTGQHDLSLDYLLGQLVLGQQQDVTQMEQCVQQLPSNTMERALAGDALAQSKRHLETLQQLAREMGQANATT